MLTPADLDEEHVRRLVVETAKRLSEREEEISGAINERLAKLDGMAPDPQMYEWMAASTSANVATVFHLLRHGLSIEQVDLPGPVVHYIRRLAQRNIRANVLIRAYHLGQDYLKEYFFDEVGRLDANADVKLRIVRRMTDAVFSLVDSTTLQVLDIHEAESRRWSTTAGHLASAVVHGILAGQQVPDDFERKTGYRVDQYHIGLICWIEADDPEGTSLPELEEVASELAKPISHGRPLLSVVDMSTAWLWVPRGRNSRPLVSEDAAQILRGMPARLPRCRASVGLPGSGEAGFRRTHQQAAAARALLSDGVEDRQVLGYGDAGVAVVAMLSHDMEELSLWVRETLGGLAVDSEANVDLRETLLEFLNTGCSFAATAERLVLHRNTVRYRIERAAEVRGRSLEHDRADLATALQCTRLLGSRVLTPHR